MDNAGISMTLAGALLAGASFNAAASCNSAYCTLMTDRFLQGAGDPHVGWTSDLRLERVTQDELRAGTKSIGADEVTGEEAIERRTRNLNLSATLGYGVDRDWSFALRVPMFRRDHQHDLIDEATGAPGPQEKWRFTRIGDVELRVRRQLPSSDAASAVAIFGGVKLPTGAIDATNSDGTRAERSLQPGTGSTDLLLGAAARRAVGLSDALIMQAGVQQAVASREAYKPGRQLELSVAWSHAFGLAFGSVVQANLKDRSKDGGLQAEPDNSGKTTLDLSPGLTWAIGGGTLYGYVQFPVYQRVRGIQLVARHATAIGWTHDF